MSCRILIADDHELIRSGVRNIIESQPDWQVVAEARTGREAVNMAAETKPDVAVLDIGMPELNGLEAARKILETSPETEVLILTMHESEQIAREILASGAHGYVLKSDAARDLGTAINALQQHRCFFTAQVSRILLEAYMDRGDAGRTHYQLSKRERQVLQALAVGKSNKEIAHELEISIKTVETHRASVMQKLDFRSLPELVRYAIRNHIIEA